MKIQNGKDQKEIEISSGVYKIYGTGGVIGYTNNFLYNKESVGIGRKGTINRPFYFNEPFWTVDTLFWCKIKENHFPKFIYYLFFTIDWNKLNQSTGVPSLTSHVIEHQKIVIPKLDEQKKIAMFFTIIDKKIDVINSKLSILKKYKEGIINLCFSKGKKYKLLSFIHQIDRRNKLNENLYVYSISNKKGFISQEEQFDGNEIASINKKRYKIVKKDEFAYNPARINVGSIAYLQENKCQISPMYIVFSAKEICNILLNEYFHSKYFKIELMTHLEGSVRKSLSFNSLCDFEIKINEFNNQYEHIFQMLNNKLHILEECFFRLQKTKNYLLKLMFI